MIYNLLWRTDGPDHVRLSFSRVARRSLALEPRSFPPYEDNLRTHTCTFAGSRAMKKRDRGRGEA